jgi:hypothetical protein
MLRLNKIFLTLQIPLEEGNGGESRPKDRVTLQITLVSLPNTQKQQTRYNLANARYEPTTPSNSAQKKLLGVRTLLGFICKDV